MKSPGLLRTFLVALFVFISAVPVSAALLSADGFLNIPWGSTARQVALEMTGRKAFRLIPLREMDGDINPAAFTRLQFAGVIAGHPATVEFRFRNDAFAEGQIVYHPEAPESLTDQSDKGCTMDRLDNELKGMLIEKFGLPQEEDNPRNHCTDPDMYRGEHAKWFITGLGKTPVSIDYRLDFPYYSSKYQLNKKKEHGAITVTYTILYQWNNDPAPTRSRVF